MSYSRNEIVLLPIPFTDLTSRKVRPAIVVGGQHNDLIVVPLTSRTRYVDWVLQDWAGAGLNVACGIKAQVATVEQSRILKVVGRLQPADVQTLDQSLRRWLSL
ncbi:MAG: type II toxin-antitoxin system PemK/MazF family toxin [Verrucomicrobiota bacterium]|nr:type II toxin-antitoxin system PemK/MazF family toxin [Verrucomicrobiota bacterium]